MSIRNFKNIRTGKNFRNYSLVGGFFIKKMEHRFKKTRFLLGMVAHTIISATWEAEIRRSSLKPVQERC
jgi:hypothetical protein